MKKFFLFCSVYLKTCNKFYFSSCKSFMISQISLNPLSIVCNSCSICTLELQLAFLKSLANLHTFIRGFRKAACSFHEAPALVCSSHAAFEKHLNTTARGIREICEDSKLQSRSSNCRERLHLFSALCRGGGCGTPCHLGSWVHLL